MPENETPTTTPVSAPTATPSKNVSTGYQKAFWILIVVLLLSAVGAAAYWYGQQTNNQAMDKTVLLASSSPSATTASPQGSSAPSTTPSPSAAVPKPVVVFESQGSISDSDLKQLNSRIVDPIIDYYKENPSQEIVSLTISPNDKPSKNEFPYLGSIVFKNGGNSGFVIAKKDGQINWWGPDCMVCTFSAEYKAKYPEITKNY